MYTPLILPTTMTEGAPRDIKETASWTVDRIAERMDQSPIPIHPSDGVDGHGFKVIDPDNADDARTIGLFPDQNIVMISTPDVSIKIKNATATAAKEGVRVDAGDGSVRALFLRDGHVAVEVFPALSLALPESPVTGDNPPDEDLSESSSPIGSGTAGDVQAASPQASERVQTRAHDHGR